MENYSDMHASLIKNFESILEINASLEQVHDNVKLEIWIDTSEFGSVGLIWTKT